MEDNTVRDDQADDSADDKVKMNVRTKVTIKDLLNEQGSLKVSNFLWPWDRGPEMVPAESGYVEYSLGH